MVLTRLLILKFYISKNLKILNFNLSKIPFLKKKLKKKILTPTRLGLNIMMIP